MPAISPAIAALIATPSRLAGTDTEIEAAFWAAHPRLRFVKTLRWGARLLDVGAGSGGVALWRAWQIPLRPDIRLSAIDRARGEHAALYDQWIVADLDAGLPRLDAKRFDGFLVSHLIEHLADPAVLVRSMAATAAPGARVYVEWPSPATKNLPGAATLARDLGFTIQTFNFTDDRTHRQTPTRPAMEAILAANGFRTVESAEIRLGALAEELIARGRAADDLTFRQMGLWCAMGWCEMIIAEFAAPAA